MDVFDCDTDDDVLLADRPESIGNTPSFTVIRASCNKEEEYCSSYSSSASRNSGLKPVSRLLPLRPKPAVLRGDGKMKVSKPSYLNPITPGFLSKYDPPPSKPSSRSPEDVRTATNLDIKAWFEAAKRAGKLLDGRDLKRKAWCNRSVLLYDDASNPSRAASVDAGEHEDSLDRWLSKFKRDLGVSCTADAGRLSSSKRVRGSPADASDSDASESDASDSDNPRRDYVKRSNRQFCAQVVSVDKDGAENERQLAEAAKIQEMNDYVKSLEEDLILKVTSERILAWLTKKREEREEEVNNNGVLNQGFGDFFVLDRDCSLRGGEFTLPLNDLAYERKSIVDGKTFDIRTAREDQFAMDSRTWSELVAQADNVLARDVKFDIVKMVGVFKKFAKEHLLKEDGTTKTEYELLLESEDPVKLKTAFLYAPRDFKLEGVPTDWTAWKERHFSKIADDLVENDVLSAFQLKYPKKFPPCWD